MENRKGMFFVAGNPPLLWQLVGEGEELQLLQQMVPSEHPAQTQEVGGGWSRTVQGLLVMQTPFLCVCVLQLLQEGRECGSCSLWDAYNVGDPSSPCPRDVIPWAFHACPREQRGQRMLQNSQNSVVWGGGVVFHLLQWKRGHSQAPLLFPEWPEALGVENSKDLVVFRVGKEWDAQPWLRDGSCIPQEGLGEGQSCSWPGWSC